MLSKRNIGILVIGVFAIFLIKHIVNWYRKRKSVAIISNGVVVERFDQDTGDTCNIILPVEKEYVAEADFIPSQTFQGAKDNYVFKTKVYLKSDNKSPKDSYIKIDGGYKYKIGYYKDNKNI